LALKQGFFIRNIQLLQSNYTTFSGMTN